MVKMLKFTNIALKVCCILAFWHPVWVLWYYFIMKFKATFITLLLLPYNRHSDHWSKNDTPWPWSAENIRNQLCVTLLYPPFWGVTVKRKSGKLYLVSIYHHIVPYFNTNISEQIYMSLYWWSFMTLLD